MAEKRIAVDATCVSPVGTGLHVVSTEIAKELLKKAGQRLMIYTSSEELMQAGGKSIRPTSRWHSPDRGMSGNLRRLLWLQSGFPVRLKRDRADVVFSPVDEGMIWPGLSQVITCWDIIVLLYPEAAPKKKYYYYYLMPRVLQACKSIVCGSENTLRDIRREYRLDDKPMHVVYPGIDHRTFRPVKSRFAQEAYGLDRFVLYVGDMRPYKNLHRALAAFARAGLPDHKFVIVGKKDGFFYPQIREKARELEIAEKVLFTDYLPTEHLPEMYSAADAFVFPSLYEGFGIPPLEAMACGTPVVASGTASIPEACGDAAYYVDPYDIDSIAGGMYKAANDPDLRKHLTEKGFERARLFTWSKSAEKILKILDEIG